MLSASLSDPLQVPALKIDFVLAKPWNNVHFCNHVRLLYPGPGDADRLMEAGDLSPLWACMV